MEKTELKFENVSNRKANGTCLQGYVRTKFDDLVSVFGQPILPNSGDGKVICEWILEFNDGNIGTIYCWKVNSIPMGEYEWHIGGHSECVVEYVKHLLIFK